MAWSAALLAASVPGATLAPPAALPRGLLPTPPAASSPAFGSAWPATRVRASLPTPERMRPAVLPGASAPVSPAASARESPVVSDQAPALGSVSPGTSARAPVLGPVLPVASAPVSPVGSARRPPRLTSLRREWGRPIGRTPESTCCHRPWRRRLRSRRSTPRSRGGVRSRRRPAPRRRRWVTPRATRRGRRPSCTRRKDGGWRSGRSARRATLRVSGSV